MKIALIDGSPKIKGSVSGMLAEDLKSYLSSQAEISEFGMHKPVIPEDMQEELKEMDAWVFFCPLYVDGIPAHLLSCLVRLEKTCGSNHEIHIYGVVNCGFHEGIQAEPALKILRNWCQKAGLSWGGGIGIGGGGGLGSMPKTERGPRAPVYKALRALAGTLIRREEQDNEYVSVAFPGFLYKIAAQAGWRQMIRANGGKIKDLGKRPG